jgi:ATP-dependent DNA ligase
LVSYFVVPKLTRKKSTVSPERLSFIQPMYARSVQQLPEEDAWAYGCKPDGYRCLAGKDSTGVTLWSRRGNVLTRDFPSSRTLQNIFRLTRC